MGMLKDMDKVSEEYASGDRTYAEFLLGQAAIAGGKVGDLAATAMDYMVPDALGIGENVSKGIQYLANTDAGKAVTGAYGDVKQAYPRPVRALEEAFDASGLLGMGAVKKGVQGLASNKGQFLTEGDVIVPGFYNPRQVEFGPKTEAFIKAQEEAFKNSENPSLLAKTFGRSEGGINKVVDAARFAKGFGEWGMEGVKRGLKSVFSPESRALYAEYGINQVDLKAVNTWKSAQNKLNELRASGASDLEITKAKRAEKEARGIAQAQLQATANIRQQANNTGATVSDEIMASVKDAVDPQVLAKVGTPYFSAKRSDDWYHRDVTPAMPDANRGDFSRVDSDVVQRHIYNAWKPSEDVKFIVKRPSTYETGKHWEDLFDRNTTLDPIAKAFVQLNKDKGRVQFENRAEMMKYLEDVQKDPKTGKKLFTIKFDDANSPENSNGIWISTAKVGSAKVEGGINTLYRVDPDGALIGVMSDKHDFLEKIWGLGQMLENRLPTEVIAVTKPLRYDIFSSRAAVFNRSKIETPKIDRETGRKWEKANPQDKPKAAFEQGVTDRLNRISNLTPSQEEISRQRRQLATAPAGFGMMGVVGATQEDQ